MIFRGQGRGVSANHRIIPFGDGPDTYTNGRIYAITIRSSEVPIGLRCVISNNFGISEYKPRIFVASYQEMTRCKSPDAVSYCLFYI